MPSLPRGRMLGLSSDQLRHALALGFNRCGGSFQSNIDGSLAVRLQQGLVAETGVECAQFAAARHHRPGQLPRRPLRLHAPVTPGASARRRRSSPASATEWRMKRLHVQALPELRRDPGRHAAGARRHRRARPPAGRRRPRRGAHAAVLAPPRRQPVLARCQPSRERPVQRAVLRRQRHHPPVGDARPLPARDGARRPTLAAADRPHRGARRSRRWTRVVTARSTLELLHDRRPPRQRAATTSRPATQATAWAPPSTVPASTTAWRTRRTRSSRTRSLASSTPSSSRRTRIVRVLLDVRGER